MLLSIKSRLQEIDKSLTYFLFEHRYFTLYSQGDEAKEKKKKSKKSEKEAAPAADAAPAAEPAAKSGSKKRAQRTGSNVFAM